MRQAPEFTLEELTGQTRGHLQEVQDPPCALHKEVIAPYLALRAAAAVQGIDLVAFSSFRDFDRQLGIWNGKFSGERPMRDRSGRPIDARTLSPAERVAAILWWSALPGTSRHHWGTDFDVMDAGALPPGYKLQAIPAEYQAGGPFERLSSWLDEHMHAFGFYRPYTTDRGGVAPEPWHLSYAPVAVRAQSALDVAGLRAVLSAAAIAGRTEVLAQLERNFVNYVVNVDQPPEVARLGPRLG
jgi:LAS superfamily LD-carboxypeptidase LdcB